MTEKWKLTDEHRAQIPDWNERWIKIIMSCDPIDVDKTTVAMRNMYRVANLAKPRVIYAPSAYVGLTMLAASASVDPASRPDTDDPFIQAIYDGAGNELVSGQRWTSEPFGNTPEEVIDNCVARIKKLEPDRTKFRTVLSNWSSYYNGGSEWGSWASYLSFVRDVVKWTHPSIENYSYYEQAVLCGGPRYMAAHTCIICDRPISRHINSDNQLHNETGPAIEWLCGAKVWYVGGVKVDEQIVMRPATQTIKQIEQENNSETKRVRIDRYGWVRYLQESSAKVVDKRHNDRDNQDEVLYRLRDGQRRFVCVDPSTGRRYALGVPREIDTCQAAQNWLSSGLDELTVHRS